jgi:hypothetical protein
VLYQPAEGLAFVGKANGEKHLQNWEPMLDLLDIMSLCHGSLPKKIKSKFQNFEVTVPKSSLVNILNFSTMHICNSDTVYVADFTYVCT